jgi:hypothetical protein
VALHTQVAKRMITVQPSAISFALVQEESRSFLTVSLSSLQSRLTQGGQMTLQHRWIFEEYSLLVNLQ